jgi:hypothetical protein
MPSSTLQLPSTVCISASNVAGSITQILGTPNSRHSRIFSLTRMGRSSGDRISIQMSGGLSNALGRPRRENHAHIRDHVPAAPNKVTLLGEDFDAPSFVPTE